MSYALGTSYSDPWTARKAAQAKQSLLRTGGVAVGSEPPAPGSPKVALVAGWGLVLAVTAGVFYAASTGAGTRAVKANRRRRSSRRRSVRRNGKMSKSAIRAKMERLQAQDDKLRDKLRELIWAEHPDAYYDWPRSKQDEYDAKEARARDAIKAKREKIDDELTKLEHMLYAK